MAECTRPLTFKLFYLSLFLTKNLGVIAKSNKVDENILLQRQLTQKQQSLRWLEDSYSAYQYDLSEYSVRFGKCQHVKTYDDEIAEDQDSQTVFATKQFIVYRICPTDTCNKCNSNYGEYAVELEDYLEATVQWERKKFEYMCENCNEWCNDYGDDCSGCGKVCYQYDNLENNGYVDASDYVKCQKLQQNDDDDGNENALYIGPRCSRDGTHIEISLFTDENCWEPYTTEDAEDLIGMKLSYHLLTNIYANDVCLSCREDGDDQDNDKDQNDADDVNEMCERLYDSSAKCEYHHGIENGFIQTNREEGNYENQVENEYKVCEFIDTLVFNSYTETGEINVIYESDEIIRVNTKLQTVTLVALSIIIGALVIYAASLHRQITSAANNAPTSSMTSPQGDTEFT